MKNILSIIIKIIVSVIYLQTLYFKFTAHPESVYIFSKLGIEPYGRVASGVIELIISIFIFIKRFEIGINLLSIFVILGAIVSHIFVIGFNINNDGGSLFFLATTIFFSNLLLIILNKIEYSSFIKKIALK
jgi:putative oxidoreductase